MKANRKLLVNALVFGILCRSGALALSRSGQIGIVAGGVVAVGICAGGERCFSFQEK